jgi:hypothetical protein
MCNTGVNDTADKCTARFVDTGKACSTGISDTGEVGDLFFIYLSRQNSVVGIKAMKISRYFRSDDFFRYKYLTRYN